MNTPIHCGSSDKWQLLMRQAYLDIWFKLPRRYPVWRVEKWLLNRFFKIAGL